MTAEVLNLEGKTVIVLQNSMFYNQSFATSLNTLMFVKELSPANKLGLVSLKAQLTDWGKVVADSMSGLESPEEKDELAAMDKEFEFKPIPAGEIIAFVTAQDIVNLGPIVEVENVQ